LRAPEATHDLRAVASLLNCSYVHGIRLDPKPRHCGAGLFGHVVAVNPSTPARKRWFGLVPGARAAWGRGRAIFNWCDYRRDFTRYRALATATKRPVPQWKERFACLGQKTSVTGFDRHYVYHTAWAARILARSRPARHVDISSSLYFVGIVSAFLPVEHFDYRPPDLRLDNVSTGFADLLALPFRDGGIPSLSCMHVVEHIGLGRYGDPLDPGGDIKAMRELSRVLAMGGQLLFAVPVGRPRVCFNAHRIYSYDQIVTAFSDLQLLEFRLVPDRGSEGGLIEATPKMVAAQDYGCGCFWLQKPARA
jgi:SAM-dependent methyltransferase